MNLKERKSQSQRILEIKLQGKITVRVQNLMSKYNASDIMSKDTKEKNMRLAHKITENCKEQAFRDEPIQDLMAQAFANNGEIRAAMYEQRLNKMHAQVHEHRVRNLEMISKMAIAHTVRNAQALQKISQLRTEINVKKTYLPKEERRQYVQEIVDCYQMDSDPILFKRKQAKAAVRETMGQPSKRKVAVTDWVDWVPPVVIKKKISEDDHDDIFSLIHNIGEKYIEPKHTLFSQNQSSNFDRKIE